jgi:hypothetical protein
MSGLTNPSPATNLKFDASNNVLANISAQDINPNINNPYLPTLVSHQTGLSASISTAHSPVNIGSSITINRNGIIKISAAGHVSADEGLISVVLTRGSLTLYYSTNQSSTSLTNSIFANTNATGISNTNICPLVINVNSGGTVTYSTLSYFEIEVISSDVIQMVCSNTTASTTTYIDDLVVMLQ